MRIIIAYIIVVAIYLGGILIATAAPTTTFLRNIIPEIDSTFEIGTSTRAFLRGTFDNLCLTGDSCITSWPVGGGGLGLATSSIDTEAELELILTDVTDVYTNNDFTDNSSNWDTAFGWGDHATANYLTEVATTSVRDKVSASSPLSYNSGTGVFSFLFNTSNTWTNNNLFSGLYVGSASAGAGQDFFLTDSNTFFSNSDYQLLGSNTNARAGIGGRTINPGVNMSAYTSFLFPRKIYQEPTDFGNVPLVSQLAIRAMAITNGDAVTDNAASLYIEGAPTGPATNEYAIWVDEGLSRFDTLSADTSLTTPLLTATYASTTAVSATNFYGELTGNASTATALEANGTNCSAGSYALGVDASGDAEGCTDATTEIASAISTHAGDADAHQALVTITGEDFLSLSTQQITANAINADNLSASDFGDFTCNGTSCSLDATYLTGNQTITLSGDITGSGTTSITAAIGSGVIIEPDLSTDVTAVDGDYLQYDSTGTNFTWRDASEVRSDLSLVIGSNVQAYDADLTTYAGITPSANVQTLLGAADYSAMRTQLALVIGTNVQAYDADLTTYAGITPSANVQSMLAAANYAAIVTLLESSIESALDALSNLVTVAVSTTLQIPFGTTCDSNSDGEICQDTSGNQLVVDGLAVPTQDVKIFGVTVASTSPAFISSGLLKVPTEIDGYTITAIRCSVESGTSKVIAIEDASGNSSEDITCGTTVTSDDGSITNATATAGEEMYIDFGATTGSVDYVSISVFGNWTRE